jgi:hypothetical protein
MSKKMTIAETFAEIIATYDLSPEHKAFLEDRANKSVRKTADGERKPTAKQLLNEAVAEAVYGEMEPNRSYTVSEMIKVIPAFDGVSASYANAIVKKLKDSGRVTRSEHKGRAYFTKVE